MKRFGDVTTTVLSTTERKLPLRKELLEESPLDVSKLNEFDIDIASCQNIVMPCGALSSE